MRNLRWFTAALLAVMLLVAFHSTAAAAGPVDDAPPETLRLQDHVSQTVASAIETSLDPRQGPQPCLNEGGGFSNVPFEVQVGGPLK